jgi:uncharacterized protein YjiS (DUF1127 family)
MTVLQLEGFRGTVADFRQTSSRKPHHRFGWLRMRLREWRRRARDRAELAALDDRTLADIGISRAEAEFLANKPFWRE